MAPGTETAVQVAQNAPIRPQHRKLHDPDVSFEEYLYYAQKTREEERTLEKPRTAWRQLLAGEKKSAANGAADESVGVVHQELGDLNLSTRNNRLHISDEEWTNASRALRTASAGAAFYLITTDILGPFAVPFAIGTLGYGPGVALFTAFGLLAGYSGYLIWHVFMHVDSYEFPARNYGDLAFRTWGTVARHITNFLQAIALLLLLGQVTILFGQNISQMSKFRLCYIVCPLVFVIAGFFLTQIRTLKAYGWVATLAIWLNLLVIFISMGVMAHSPPNYAIAVLGSAGSAVDPDSITPVDGVYPPIVHYSGLPANNLVGNINGLLSGVLAYAGAQLFVEFLAEMRRPRDFLKFQGQYTYNPSFQGVSAYSWQTVGNAITLLAGLIAAGLYGNIGIKVFYNNVLVDLLNAPLLVSKPGKLFYAALVPVWWSVAFVIAAAIPDYFGFISVMSASTLLNLTYTLPPLFALGMDIRKNAMRPGEGFNPETGEVTRNGTAMQRYIRGFFSGGPLQLAKNVWHVLYFLASLAMCGLGMYAAVQGMVDAFKHPQLNSFSCVSPLNLNA
ncbi:46fc58f0-96f7-4996-8023-12658bfbb7a1 [Thermothielavioides terrestris]|uniref:46fc58f0-96f7-4996-8023-12658bfbb7a1 n=1 Tax=Thermothielavioides terrestris TaxID=2587410 RepID=A0A3S4D8M1_9PEZI|nr:46fc58f0-96f7-4996-8023-12658bfbb7a1 [Thermothielavioides terrestris]